jgi:hypothetical protein
MKKPNDRTEMCSSYETNQDTQKMKKGQSPLEVNGFSGQGKFPWHIFKNR